MIQVPKEHYDFKKYLSKRRWSSYWHQINEVISFGAKSVLVIGIGDGIVPLILKSYHIKVYTLDHDPDMNPDYLGDVSEFDKIADRSFDCILCCQVLEHLPYETSVSLLKVFAQKTKRLICSLPCGVHEFSVNIRWKKKKIRRIKYVQKFSESFPPQSEHYWELGYKKYSKQNFIIELQKHFSLIKQYHVAEFPYHIFFILDAKSF